MKIRPSLLWICVFAVCLMIVALFWRGKRPSDVMVFETTSQTANSRAATRPTNRIAISTRPNVDATVSSSQAVQTNLPQDRAATLAAILDANDVDIVFYGKLEDQYSNIVASAKVDFSVRYENASGSGVKRGQILADARNRSVPTFYTSSRGQAVNSGK